MRDGTIWKTSPATMCRLRWSTSEAYARSSRSVVGVEGRRWNPRAALRLASTRVDLAHGASQPLDRPHRIMIARLRARTANDVSKDRGRAVHMVEHHQLLRDPEHEVGKIEQVRLRRRQALLRVDQVVGEDPGGEMCERRRLRHEADPVHHGAEGVERSCGSEPRARFLGGCDRRPLRDQRLPITGNRGLLRERAPEPVAECHAIRREWLDAHDGPPAFEPKHGARKQDAALALSTGGVGGLEHDRVGAPPFGQRREQRERVGSAGQAPHQRKDLSRSNLRTLHASVFPAARTKGASSSIMVANCPG